MRTFFFILTLLLLISCNKENRCLDRPGDAASIIVPFDSSISNFHIYDNLDVLLTNDSITYIEISGGKNLISNIDILVNLDKIEFTNSNKCLFYSKNDHVELNIHYRSLNELYLMGYGDVRSNNKINSNLKIHGHNCFSSIDLTVENDSTYIAFEGAPQIKLQGHSNYLYAYSFGKGNYDCSELQTHTTHGHNSSLGDLYLSADQQYILELRSKGDIYLKDTIGINLFVTNEGEGQIFLYD